MKNLSFALILAGLTFLSLKSNAHSIIGIQKNALADTSQRKVIDPVCKMKINPSTKTTVYNKITYYFCSESCKQKFVAAPAKYIKK